MGIWQNSFTRVIFQYKTYNFPSFQTFSFIGVLTLFYTNFTNTDVLPVHIIVMIKSTLETKFGGFGIFIE